MNSSPVYRGVKVHWAVGSTGVSGNGTFKLQSRDHNMGADSEVVQDATGFAVNKTYFNFNESATLEIVNTSSGTGGDLTPTIPSPSDMLTITDTIYTQIAGTTWLVDGVSTKSSNTSALRTTLNLTRYALITT